LGAAVQYVGESFSSAAPEAEAAAVAVKDWRAELKAFQAQLGHEYLGVPTLADKLKNLAQSAGIGSGGAAEALSRLDVAALQRVAEEWGVTEDVFMSSSAAAVAGLRDIEEAARAIFADLLPDIEQFRNALGHDYLGLPTLAREIADFGAAAGVSAEDAAAWMRTLSPERIVEIATQLGVPYEVLLDSAHEALQLMQADAAALEEQAAQLAETRRNALGAALDDLGKSIDAEKQAADKAHGDRMAALQAEHDAVMANYAAQIEAATANRDRLAGIVDMLRGAQAQVGPQSAEIDAYTRAKGQAELADMARTGTLDGDRIAAALEAVSAPGRFGSRLDEMRDAARTADSVGKLTENAEKQLSDAERTLFALESAAAQEQANFAAAQEAAAQEHAANIERLDALYAEAEKQTRAALGSEELLLSIAQAQSGFAAALAEMTGAPGFAEGGTHSGGLRLVGENGPELEVTGPSRIIPPSQLAAPDNSALIAELRALRAELQNGQIQVAKNTAKTARYLERWDGDGLPAERVL
jgi:hypothetical protein